MSSPGGEVTVASSVQGQVTASDVEAWRVSRLGRYLSDLLSSGPASVYDPVTAMGLPSVARAVQLIAGLVRQCPLDDYRGVDPLPRPGLLEQPDPEQARSWFVGQHVEDYLLSGNAIHLITVRGADGFPLAAQWIPASWVAIEYDQVTGTVEYWMEGVRLPRGDVVHVKRGADPNYPVRGRGVVEQHLDPLNRVADEERYESSTLNGSGVPSVAIISPNPRVSPEETESAKQSWMEKFGGPIRAPALLPNGSQVIPLSWSPSDSQLTEARKQSLTDVANIFNMDGYWLGAPASSHTYRAPSGMYLELLRQTLEPILDDFEGVWSQAWLPRGRQLRFSRQTLLRDDLQTMVSTLSQGLQAGLFTVDEARVYLGLAPLGGAPAGEVSTLDTFQVLPGAVT